MISEAFHARRAAALQMHSNPQKYGELFPQDVKLYRTYFIGATSYSL